MDKHKTFVAHSNALPGGHRILWYQVERVLGQGSFGITYLVQDLNLGRLAAIKEYLPVQCACRQSDATVHPLSADHDKVYRWGLSSFLTEAQTLAKFQHPNIVRVQSVFEQNNTAYMVMDYELGEDLATRFKHCSSSLNQQSFEAIFLPIIDGLQRVHGEGFIHRDIKPSNIFIRNNLSPVLLDFGSARQLVQQESGALTTLVTHGYTPPEQYNLDFGEQGAWTDIYAIAGCIYCGITGQKPANSLSRMATLQAGKDDPVVPLVRLAPPGYDRAFLKAVDHGLAVFIQQRPSTLSQWLQEFPHSPPLASGSSSTVTAEETTLLLSNRLDPVRPTETGAGPSGMKAEQSSEDMAGRCKQPLRKRLISASAVAAVLVLAGWHYLGGPRDKLSLANLDALPVPPTELKIASIEARFAEHVEKLFQLGSLYRQALRADPRGIEAQQGLTTVMDQYQQLLADPWLRNSPVLAKQIAARAIELTPEHSHFLSLQQQTRAPVALEDINRYLSEGNIGLPVGRSVVDSIYRLSPEDLTLLSKQERWNQLLNSLIQQALEAIRSEDYPLAKRIVEAGLFIAPASSRFDDLRRHLESSR